jgi:hypothetical protein
MYVETKSKLCNILCGNNSKALSCFSHVFINWNDFEIDNILCNIFYA